MILDQLRKAYTLARDELLAAQEADGHWVGRLSSSALATATATSALALAARHVAGDEAQALRAQVQPLVDRGLAWLAARRTPTAAGAIRTRASPTSPPRCSSARRCTWPDRPHPQRVPGPAMLARAEDYIARPGGLAGLRRRYGKDKTFAVPILTNAALAGLAAGPTWPRCPSSWPACPTGCCGSCACRWSVTRCRPWWPSARPGIFTARRAIRWSGWSARWRSGAAWRCSSACSRPAAGSSRPRR